MMSQTDGYISNDRPTISHSFLAVAYTNNDTTIDAAHFTGNIDNYLAAIPINLTLPDVALVEGKTCRIAQVNNNAVKITAAAQTIVWDSKLYTAITLPGAGSAAVLHSDGQWWHVEIAAAAASLVTAG